MLAFNRANLVNLTRNMVMLNGLNQLNLPKYNHECNEKMFTRKITVISTRKFHYINRYYFPVEITGILFFF